jgi:aminoglycoside phosphotransferase (APT) family kinase protein
VDATSRATAAVRRHAPGLAGDLRALGSGVDHAAFLAGDLVVRVGADASREARLLQVVGPRVPLPVPAPVFVDEDAGVLAYRLLPGRPLLGRPAVAGAPQTLGRFLRALHDVDLETVAGLVPTEDADPSEWLAELTGPAELLQVLRETAPERGGHRVLAHADLGAEHLLARDGALTGVIDWTDAAVTDPAVDFARLLRDFGPAFLHELREAYGPDAPPVDRIRFFARCAALEDLAYGREAYQVAARRSLSWLF